MTKTIVITGASAGIGKVTAHTFLRSGWNVALLARRPEELHAAAADHANALPVPCDVTQEAAVDAAFQAVVARFGRIDALFNNAGIGRPAATIDEVSLADWTDVVAINLTGMFLCARAAFRQMRAQDPQGGRIINNGSISAHAPRPGSVCYTTTKHGVTGLTRTLSLDGRPFGIACGQIDIGNARTELAARMERGVPQADGSIRAEPMIDPQVVADTVLYMAGLPDGANAQFLTVMATNMPFIGRG